MSSEKHVSACGSTRSDKPFLLPPGTPLQLEIQDVSVKMNSLSVGYVAEKCLIIKYPSTGGFGPVSNKLFKGNKITVRYVNDGSVFGFQSESCSESSSTLYGCFSSDPLRGLPTTLSGPARGSGATSRLTWSSITLRRKASPQKGFKTA